MPTDGQRLRAVTRHPASRPAAGWAYPRLLAAALTIVVAACSRGPAPPSPTEDLRPTVVGVVVQGGTEPPFLLENGETFDPPEGASVRHVKNWPADSAFEEDEVPPGALLLGGQAPDGSWWYEIAGLGGPNINGCWPVHGGSFDEGATIQFSSGLIVPKAPSFDIRPPNSGVEAFPGHGDDYVCLDADGRAMYFQLHIGA